MAAPPGLPHPVLWLLQHPVLLIGIGSGCGGVARYYLGRAVDRWSQSDWPWGTFFVNSTGSFVLGVVAFLVFERLPAGYRWVYLLLGTGFCGGYTTFSTFSYETLRLFRDGAWWSGIGYVTASAFAGLLGVLCAALLVRPGWRV